MTPLQYTGPWQEGGDHIRHCEGRNYTCTCGYDDAVEKTITTQAAEIERLRGAFRAVDAQDWEYLEKQLGNGGQDRFWKAVFSDIRAALKEHKP